MPAATQTVNGDPCTGQLDQLFRDHYERIARVIGRVIHDQARAEEIAVEVFIKWKRKAIVKGEQAEGWLYRSAVRDALDEWRRQTRKARFERLLIAFKPSRPPNPEQMYAASEEQLRVRYVLAALDRRHAEALLLWGEDLNHREIAATVGIPFNCTGSLLSRAQAAFRKEYEKRNAK